MQSPKGQVRVGLVTDVGKIDDGTFNQYAYKGMMRAAEEFGLETTYIETARPDDGAGNVLTLIEQGYQVIITVGRVPSEMTERIAKDHPDVNFVTIDFAPYPALPNVMGLLFADESLDIREMGRKALDSQPASYRCVSEQEL